jgi:4-hydroxy-tetrahydrodipicolinate synthase
MVRFDGIFAATVTPFSEAGGLDYDALKRLIDRLISAGIRGLVPCGSTGEFPHLTADERRQVVEHTIAYAGGRVPVVPHTGALTTEECVALSRHAGEAGAAAIMVAPPFYDKPNWSELVDHYRTVANAVDLPLVVYNIPSATKINFSPSQLAELAEIPNVRYVKDSSGDAVALTELIQRYGDQITTFNGWDTLTFYGFALGTRASIWGAANFIPELCVELFEATVRNADLKSARSVWARIWPICNFLENAGYVAAVKAGCALVGNPVGLPRRPFAALSQQATSQLETLLVAAGVGVTSPAKVSA